MQQEKCTVGNIIGVCVYLANLFMFKSSCKVVRFGSIVSHEQAAVMIMLIQAISPAAR